MRKNQKADLPSQETDRKEREEKGGEGKEEKKEPQYRNSLESTRNERSVEAQNHIAGKTSNRSDENHPESIATEDSPTSSRLQRGKDTSTRQDSTGENKPGKTTNHGSLYLGLASALLIAAIGISLSTLPILISIPLAAMLFGIGIWFLSYASFRSRHQAGETVQGSKSSQIILITTVFLVIQTFIMDIFIFTRLGTVNKYQNPVIIMWIACTMIESLAALVLIYSYRPTPLSEKAAKTGGKEEMNQGQD